MSGNGFGLVARLLSRLGWLRQILEGLRLVEESVDQIVRPITKITDKLEKHAAKQIDKSAAETTAAMRLMEASRRRAVEADRAKAAAHNLGALARVQ